MSGSDPQAPAPAQRVPPEASDSEGIVIAMMMVDPGTIDVLIGEGFEAKHCYGDANRRIVEAIYDMHTKGDKIDVVTVSHWLRARDRLEQVGGTPYLAQVCDSPYMTNYLEHASLVREKYRVREAIKACQLGAAQGYAPIENTQEYLESIEIAISDIAHEGRRINVEPVGTVAVREVSRLAEARTQGLSTLGLETGFKDFDKMTGGLMKGNVYIVAARPGMGKTAFVASLLLNVSRPMGHPDAPVLSDATMLFSLEMARDQIGLRILCHEAGPAMTRVVTSTLSQREWGQLTEASVGLQRVPLYIDDTPAIDLLQVRAAIRKLKRELANGSAGVNSTGKLGAIAIDYLQLMGGQSQRGRSREEEVAALSRGLKLLAKEEDIPVIALAQLNRDVEKSTKDKRPRLSDLRESGSIEQDADSVSFLYRGHYYDKDQNKHEAELIIAKQRNGPTGTVKLYFEPEPMRFYNAEQETGYEDDPQYWNE